MVELPEEFDDFWREVRKPPSRQAQVIALRYIDDLSVAEIAQVLGVAEGTVKAQLHKGRNRLRRRLETRDVVHDPLTSSRERRACQFRQQPARLNVPQSWLFRLGIDTSPS